ncbi:hypothetical protein FDECE_819 [Fusarium decemcellulare]|nr:hypothetical protein FDECE_819 [Fusarium decemcellulare]
MNPSHDPQGELEDKANGAPPPTLTVKDCTLITRMLGSHSFVEYDKTLPAAEQELLAMAHPDKTESPSALRAWKPSLKRDFRQVHSPYGV